MVVCKNDTSLMKDKKWGKVLFELFSVKTQFKMLQNKFVFFLNKRIVQNFTWIISLRNYCQFSLLILTRPYYEAKVNSINILGWLYGKFYTVWLWRDVIRGSLYYRHFHERFLYFYENRYMTRRDPA